MERTRTARTRATIALAAGLAFWAVPRSASAGGFQLNEMAPRYLGTALAGMGSEAIDASVGYYNPAGLTRVKSGSLSATAAGVRWKFKKPGPAISTFAQRSRTSSFASTCSARARGFCLRDFANPIRAAHW